MTFEELIALLQNPGDDGLPETIYDDLSASYNGMAEGGAAKVAQLEEALAEATTKLTGVMAHNYELLTAVQVGNPEDVSGDLDEVNEGDEDAVTFDDLISYE